MFKDTNLNIGTGRGSTAAQQSKVCTPYRVLAPCALVSVLAAAHSRLQQRIKGSKQIGALFVQLSGLTHPLPFVLLLPAFQVRRPSNYVPGEAINLGPVTPDPTIDTTG